MSVEMFDYMDDILSLQSAGKVFNFFLNKFFNKINFNKISLNFFFFLIFSFWIVKHVAV